MRNLPDYQRLAEIFQRSVDCANEQLHCNWLIWAGQHQACARFCEKIIRRLAKPLLIEGCAASRSLEISDNSIEAGIVCARENFFRKCVRERCNLARRATEPVVRHCTGERETVLDHIEAVHVVCRSFHSSPRSECAHRFEIALSAIEKIAVQSKNYIRTIQFWNEPCASSECALRCSYLLLTQERFINAPAHARKSFFQFSPQSVPRGRMRFSNQKRKTIALLAAKRVAKRSDVSIKVVGIARFAFVNEAPGARRIV